MPYSRLVRVVDVETMGALKSVAANMVRILIVSLVLAICVGIGSILTQYAGKSVIDFSLAGGLTLLFFVITAFAGTVFSLILKH